MIWEDPTRNWRRSYHETIAQNMADLRLERSAQVKRQVWIDNRRYSVMALTDRQIELVAWREAERSINRAILERSEALQRGQKQQRLGY